MIHAHPDRLSSPATQSNAVSTKVDVMPDEYSHLESLLKHKLRGTPPGHLPDIKLRDIIQRTSKTTLENVPEDIGLTWFLRNRALLDSMSDTGQRTVSGAKDENGEGGELRSKMVRAIWFYRLDPARQFQRWHDVVRWNLAICVALLTSHTLRGRTGSEVDRNDYNDRKPSQRVPRREEPNPKLSPAAVRFLTSYLAAVIEHHNTPTLFSARETFIRLHDAGSLDLFQIHKSWAKKVLQKEMKRLSQEWEVAVSWSRRELGKAEYEVSVGRLVGSLIPGRMDQGSRTGPFGMKSGSGRGRDAEGNEMLDALRVPCLSSARTAGDQRSRALEEEKTMVCDLRTAITCVQNMRARDMLPVLMRLFPPDEVENRIPHKLVNSTCTIPNRQVVIG